MKRSISLILAVALVFCFCIIPVAAADELTATVAATLVGEDVPQAGDVFVVSIDATNISTSTFWAGEADFAWPTEVASLADSIDGTVIDDAENAYYAVEIENEFSGRTGKYDLSTSFNFEKGTAMIAITVNTKASDKSAEIGDSKNICKISFVLNEGYTYDDFYLTLSEGIIFLDPENAKAYADATNVGGVSLVSIEKPVEAVYTNPAGKQVPEAVFDLPQIITDSAKVTFDLVVNGADDALVAFDKKSNILNDDGTKKSGNFFADSSAYLPINSTRIAARNGGSNVDLYNYVVGETVSVEMDIDVTNQLYNVTVKGVNGTGTATGYAFRAAADVLDALVLVENGNENADVLTVSNLKIESTTVRDRATVTFDYQIDGVSVKTAAVEGYVGEKAEVAAVQFAKNGKLYAADATSAEIVSGGATVVVALAEVANTVVASKTEFFNVTQNTVGVYPADRTAPSEDALFSASWNDVRYGEIYLPLTVGEGEGVNEAVLTLTPGDIMSGQPNTFVIYVADPATYGTANDIDTLEVVGKGTFTAVDAATDVTLDLTQYFNNYPEAEAVLLLYKVTGGLMGVYGASAEQAPYLTYEIGEAAEPTEPSSEATEPSSEATEPSSEATEPSSEATEPSSEATEPSSEATEPSSEATEPSSEATEPSSEATEPSSEATEPSSEATEPSSEATEPSSEATEPSSEATEPTIPEDALVAAGGQNEAGIFELDKAITTTAKVSFTVVPVVGVNNTLVAINDSAQMTDSNYFSNSSVFFLLNDGKISTRDAENKTTVAIADFEAGVAYTFVVDVDVENKTASYVISDENGVVAEGVTPFRNANVEVLDSIVLINNDNAADSLYVTDLDVEVSEEPPVEELPFVNDGTEKIISASGITVNAKFATETGANEGETVVVITTFFKDDKPYVALATTAVVVDGKISASTRMNITDSAKYTVEGISVLAGTNPAAAITAENLGTPIGVIK